MAVDAAQDAPAVEDFRAQAQEFLDHAAPRGSADAAEFEFSEAEDRVTLFRGATVEEANRTRDWQRRVFDAGFGWIAGPTEYGGAGLSTRHERAYQELERKHPVPSRSPLGVSLGMVFPTLLQFGTDAAKRKWLRALRRGDAIGCQLFSEPGAGSDLAAITTKANYRPDTQGWTVSGQKVWTSGAHYSDIGLLLAQSSKGERHHNLTAFLVDMHASGVEVRPLRQMTGGADFNEVFLDNVVVPDENRLGEVDAGWRVALSTLMYERGAIGGSTAGGSGLFRLDRILNWLKELGCSEDPAVRQAFARLHTGLIAARAMRARAEAAVKAGTTPGPEMSLSKLALTANLAALSHLVGVALGPRLLADTGERGTFSWSEFVLGVPGMRLGGGTDEIQRDIIAHRVLGLPKEPAPATTNGHRAAVDRQEEGGDRNGKP